MLLKLEAPLAGAHAVLAAQVAGSLGGGAAAGPVRRVRTGAVCSSSHMVLAGSAKLAKVRGGGAFGLSSPPWKMCQFTP